MDFRRETLTAIGVVERGLELARFGTGDVHFKVGRDVVTDTDVAVEDLIRDSLLPTFGWPVIGEERGGDAGASEPHWLVDPICGTRNFASGIPLYSINVALVENGRVDVSVVGDGATGSVLVAERGHGTWSLRDGAARRLSANDASQTVDLEAWPEEGEGREHAAQCAADMIRSDRWNIRALSTTLSLAYVASGQLAGCVLFAAPSRVHTAAGTLLVEEAGGVVTDISGGPWTLDSSSLICSATSQLHDQLLRVVRAP